ncbi:hypothetical protein RO3G_08215 [Rhizopus delemar RA 99-880]|uniref:Uncharacterized protein n=1 Tax=Rhizopus delemar (strain RA 99-880 / ATCC MYA-4621 / FGSC 9543 / NRRL 43880) TaxID=246409 RepID=I1C4Y0_RHIO9|nr:hypothetical protein RO3G_08215 [Rhizopus delemar RA 99-880]|eukprot:EIE83510.1 hypothetical protein RO3G_08215 [Rhizopus delemar RA 99-880]
MILAFKTLLCLFGPNGHDNVYNKDGERVFDQMEGVLTEISDPNVVLETITSQKPYLSLKPAEKEATARDSTKKAIEAVKKAASTKTTTTKPERYLLTK